LEPANDLSRIVYALRDSGAGRTGNVKGGIGTTAIKKAVAPAGVLKGSDDLTSVIDALREGEILATRRG
jgi:hypothetical protein